jgi:hypothetical protein
VLIPDPWNRYFHHILNPFVECRFNILVIFSEGIRFASKSKRLFLIVCKVYNPLLKLQLEYKGAPSHCFGWSIQPLQETENQLINVFKGLFFLWIIIGNNGNHLSHTVPILRGWVNGLTLLIFAMLVFLFVFTYLYST